MGSLILILSRDHDVGLPDARTPNTYSQICKGRRLDVCIYTAIGVFKMCKEYGN